jgi:two-component system response regulator YesN
MFTLLVVDDEEYALRGITQGIDWSALDIGRVLPATSFDEARAILETNAVDVVVSDIEMPGKNGIDLLVWLQAHQPEIPTIFLTGHASFQYARQALQHGCVEYLLKPVEYGHLTEVVKKALEQRQYEQDRQVQMAYYEEYKHLWDTQQPMLSGHLWRDLVQGRMPGDSHRLQELFRAMNIPVTPGQPVLLVLVKIERWQESLDVQDREVMRFAVRNIASETLLNDMAGAVFPLVEEAQMAVVYNAADAQTPAALVRNAETFIDSCNLHLGCQLSCYVSQPTDITEISVACRELLRQEQENLTKPNSVIRVGDFSELSSSTLKAPDFPEWTMMLESGRLEPLLARVRDYLKRIGEGHASKEMLESFCYGIISMVYGTLHKSGLEVSDVFPEKTRIQEGLRIASPQQALQWARELLEGVHGACARSNRNESAMVREVKAFIEGHILQNFTREDIANALHFNADYLSRVFKKETGAWLSDHIITHRMNIACKQLEETDKRIADIAQELGYNHSHFARQFRNIIGQTPQEYRMKHRKFQA